MGAPPDIDTALAWRGRTVCDRDGEELGKLSALYLDNETRLPAWAGVKRGRLLKTETIVPLGEATEVGDDAIQIPYDRAQFDEAPDIDPDVALTAAEERLLHEHYGREWSEPSGEEGDAGATASWGEEGDAGVTPSSGEEGDPGVTASSGEPDTAMTRSEEEVSVGKKTVPAERVRLKKVIVQDEVTETVPVRREEIRLEEEPPPEGRIESVEDVDDASRADDRSD